MAKKYSVALFIGRFQPFHNGHLYSLKKAVEIADRVVVGVGSANEAKTENNPLDLVQRVQMVDEVIEQEKLSTYVLKVVGIDDYPSDDDWMREVEQKVGGFDVVVGNNSWTNNVIKESGRKVYKTGFHNRDELEGVKIRKLISDGDSSWMERVPSYLVSYISDAFGIQS